MVEAQHSQQCGRHKTPHGRRVMSAGLRRQGRLSRLGGNWERGGAGIGAGECGNVERGLAPDG